MLEKAKKKYTAEDTRRKELNWGEHVSGNCTDCDYRVSNYVTNINMLNFMVDDLKKDEKRRWQIKKKGDLYALFAKIDPDFTPLHQRVEILGFC